MSTKQSSQLMHELINQSINQFNQFNQLIN